MNKASTNSQVATMSSLADSLRAEFPLEQTPFGQCVIVPSKSFKPEWEQQLRAEGYKVFSQSWNGEASFFVRLENSNTKKRRLWTSREVEQLKDLVSSGLTHAQIASKLDRSRCAVSGKIRGLGLNQTRVLNPPTSKLEKPNPTSMGNDVVKEFLSACSLLYPSHKTACAYLLKEASNQILGKQNG